MMSKVMSLSFILSYPLFLPFSQPKAFHKFDFVAQGVLITGCIQCLLALLCGKIVICCIADYSS